MLNITINQSNRKEKLGGRLHNFFGGQITPEECHYSSWKNQRFGKALAVYHHILFLFRMAD